MREDLQARCGAAEGDHTEHLEVLVAHRNAPLTVEGRRRLCRRVDAGRPIAHVAAEAGISRQCLSGWHARWRAEGEAGLVERSSRPHRSPNRTPIAVERRIERLRRDRKLGPDRIASELRRHGTLISASGVHRVLVRLGISRLRDLDPPTGEQLRQADPASTEHGPHRRRRRYERQRPGELIHLDVKKLGRIRLGGGWWAHGRDSAQSRASRSAPRVGYDYVHVAIDDYSRLAYVEVLDSENGQACAGFLRRAVAFFAAHGIPRIERVMTDNAMAYTRSRLFAAVLAEIGATHKPIRPRCPWINGKAERFNRTLALEWAYAAVYDSSAERVAALPAWLHGYNHHRPHTALGGHPPAHRVNNLCTGNS